MKCTPKLVPCPAPRLGSRALHEQTEQTAGQQEGALPDQDQSTASPASTELIPARAFVLGLAVVWGFYIPETFNSVLNLGLIGSYYVK